MIKPTWALLDAILANTVHAAPGLAGILNVCFLGTATAIVDNGLNTTLSNVTEGTWDGAARISCTPFGTSYHTVAGIDGIDSAMVDFVPTGSLTPNVITGVFGATLALLGSLLFYELLAAPVTLNGGSTHLPYVASIYLDGSGNWGKGETW